MTDRKPYEDIDWRTRVQVILGYLPPFVRPEEARGFRRAVVVYDPKLDVFLRGPTGGFGSPREAGLLFWDVYGDDWVTVEAAYRALFSAPDPRPASSTFEIAINTEATATEAEGQ